MQITYWGPDHPQTDLHDYAHKEWCGLLWSLYVQRWRAFREDMLRVMQGGAASTDYFQMEKRWTEDASFISAPKTSPQQLSDLLERITGISSLEHGTR